MAQVPYQPFSTVTPQSPGEQVRENAVPEAFGVNVGEAIQHLGTTGQQVGQELFQRAQAMQELKNQTDAMSVGIDHSVEAGKLESWFKSLPEGDKANALPGYLDQQRTLRNQFREKLGNAQSQHFFDSDSAPFLRRIIFQASSISGDAQQKYELKTMEDTMDMKIKTTEDYPTDAQGIARREAELTDGARAVARYKWGHNLPDDSPIVKAEVQRVISQNALSQVTGLLKTGDIEGAQAALDRNEGKIIRDDFIKMQNQIEYKSTGVIANGVTQGVLKRHRQDDGTYDVSTTDMVKEAQQEVTDKWPRNKALSGIVGKNLETQIDIDRRAARIDYAEGRNALHSMVLKFNVTNRGELLAVPGGAALVAKMPEEFRRGLDGYIVNWRRQANAITRPETLQQLNGLKNNDTEAFLNITDFSKYKELSVQDVTALQNEQVKIAKNPQFGNDPRVNTAMGVMRGAFAPQMNDLKIFSRGADPKQQQNYDSMTGMVQTALDLWPEQHGGKTATANDIKETIGPQILQHYTEHTWRHWWSGEEHPAFQGYRRPMPEEVPQEFKDTATMKAREGGLGTPTPHQIYKSYLQMLFDKTLSDYKKGKDASK